MTDIDVRRTAPDEYRAAAAAMSGALMFPPPTDELWAEREASWADTVSYSAWADGRCVGQASYFTFDTVVPGGARLGTAGVTRVGVQPTARRRGVASRLIRSLVDQARADGLALASLRASEATIYGRFGFGVAGTYTSVTIDPLRARPVRGAALGGTIRMLAADEVLAVVMPLYERIALRRAGMVTRPAALANRYFEGVVKATASEYVVVHTNADGVDDGYAHYGTKWSESPTGSFGEGTVHEVVAADDATELALWRFVLDVDLVKQWKAEERPLDDLVQHALRDRRAYRVTDVDDEQWLRLVDVDRALRARTYQPVDASVVVEVADPWVPANNGRWRISADGAHRDDAAAADLIAPIEALSAAYLGGHPWWQLVAVGDVRSTGAAAAHADSLFVSVPAPFCGSFF